MVVAGVQADDSIGGITITGCPGGGEEAAQRGSRVVLHDEDEVLLVGDGVQIAEEVGVVDGF